MAVLTQGGPRQLEILVNIYLLPVFGGNPHLANVFSVICYRNFALSEVTKLLIV